ncbi:hypothetical protein [Streptomyces sp. NRRL F-5135]|uniref:hypothetical protein n=1 Tax=Streptomyces sp. NRRL F-5135 TaxID=1463858 RepID=UPI0004C51C3A|nr:hypothetical protein [Streptomyces sp. NRRL F-5135]
MTVTVASARAWAETILRQLDAPGGHALSVTAGPPSHSPDVPPTDSAYTSRLHLGPSPEQVFPPTGTHGSGVLLTLTFDDASEVTVHLDGSMAPVEAIVLLADQLQDAVMEHTGGFPAPPCPASGHGHPAVARVLDGTACWTCPRNGASRPILPGTAA